eukprot:CAMPEP_0181431896 /NCGR_PEP_ID=MMETSP1110-20121109/18489_1 /TAXON_ID=174948 /ORGANISM="Symbiodinium sp., Strain CCMP421" /LENGTH=62 /DNA_ID=CAMNT_0023555285 /DNA_START=19 /DNA_END=207 /DNA_ORIENTATION=+
MAMAQPSTDTPAWRLEMGAPRPMVGSIGLKVAFTSIAPGARHRTAAPGAARRAETWDTERTA